MDQKQFERLQTAVQTVVDEDRAYKAMIKDDRESYQFSRSWFWDQGTWGWGRITDEVIVSDPNQGIDWNNVCGSGGCLAGTIVHQHGDHFVMPMNKAYVNTQLAIGRIVNVEFCTDEDGLLHEIEDRARDLVGITREQKHQIFAGGLTAGTIVRLATAYAKQNGYTLEVI